MSERKTTTTCLFCLGAYKEVGWCPKFGLKFHGSLCREIKVQYKEVRVRNNVPWWKFWKRHYNIEKIIIQ